ncbi:hypothetical protein [Sorangium sp. So ce542]|uniref:hypothetical protein n=1 Tax=Sorangium sp. So ce542 TaxID=3133316 RepID=UPI003F5DB126
MLRLLRMLRLLHLLHLLRMLHPLRGVALLKARRARSGRLPPGPGVGIRAPDLARQRLRDLAWPARGSIRSRSSGRAWRTACQAAEATVRRHAGARPVHGGTAGHDLSTMS